jgi:hypothetical protein
VSDNALVLAVGKKGSGKTYKLQQIAKRCRRAIIADPEGKWPVRRGDQVVTSGLSLTRLLRDVGALDPRVRFRIVYRETADRMALAAPGAAFCVRNVTLVFDELAWITPRAQAPDYLKWLVQFGRERRINLLATTREPQEIPDLIFSQADLVYFFQMQPGNGLDRVRRRYGAELSDALPNLPARNFRTYGNEGDVLPLFGHEGS